MGHRFRANFCTENQILRAQIEVASLELHLVQSPFSKTFCRPAGSRGAQAPNDQGRPAGREEGARGQASSCIECGQPDCTSPGGGGHRARRLHHGEHLTMRRRRPEVRPSEQVVHGGSTSSTHHGRLMTAATWCALGTLRVSSHSSASITSSTRCRHSTAAAGVCGLSDRCWHACAAPQHHTEMRATLLCMHPVGWATTIHDRLGLAVRWRGVQ